MREPSAGRRKFDDGSDGMPWWVKAIGFVGVPAAIAMYLIWALVQNVVPAMFEMQKTMTTMASSIASVSADHAASKVQNDDILKVLRGTCLNQAKTYDDRMRCL